MAHVEIRQFEPRDHDNVVALWTAVFQYSNYSAPHNDPAKIIERKLAVQRELFYVAVLDVRLVGTVMGGYDGHRGWIYSLAVSPDVQRRGIGSSLMKHVEQELQNLGCPKINLQVVAANSAILGLYTKLGYLIEDRVSLGKVTSHGRG